MVRKVVADNVRALRDRVYAHLEYETQRNQALATDAGMAKSQVFRILDAEKLGCSIDYIEWLAKALKVQPADLLTPYFSHQVIVSVTERSSTPAPVAHKRAGTRS